MKLSISDQLLCKCKNADFCQSLGYNGQGPSATHKMLKTSIFDGAMYKSISAPNDPKLSNISVSWNVDGVPIFIFSFSHLATSSHNQRALP